MIFILQGVSSRRDADDRVSNEYIRRSWVHPIFWSSLGMVAITGAVLLAEEFGSAGAPGLDSWPSLRNLTILGAAAFAANLLLSGVLFERALRFVQPDRWRALRRQVNERDVRRAVRAFLRRHRRLGPITDVDDSDWTLMFPGPAEGSADEAIRSVLDDARRAMGERRHGDFTRALNSIKELIEYAMDEIAPQVPHWEAPGAQPEWPPLAELDRNLYTFREDVIQRGNREHGFALLDLDYWLLRTGVQRRCGELFTVALEGYRRNYEIASRVGSNELREMFRDRAWSVMPGALVGVTAEDGFPYLRHAVGLQERLLSDAMHRQDSADFGQTRDAFSDLLNRLRFSWGAARWPRPASADLYEELQRIYRIRLMGLGGRAMLLAEPSRISDPGPYVGPARDAYENLGQLAGDIPQILAGAERGQSLWSEWEMEGARSLQVRRVRPEQYPLTFFSVRLLELAVDPMPVLDLGGSAQRVLEWFEANIDRLERHVQLGPESGFEERRELALGALRAAVNLDDVAVDEDIIRRDISKDRLCDFEAEVYASMFTANTIEQLFAHAGAFLYAPSDAADAPAVRSTHELIEKGALTDAKNWEPYRDLRCGESFEHDIAQQLCAALNEAHPIGAAVGSGLDLLKAIDEALSDLDPQGSVILLLEGAWADILSDLDRIRPPPDGYEPWWANTDSDLPEPLRRYHGYPIIEHRDGSDRHLYVGELPAWGAFVRAQVEGDTDLLIEVEEISPERAQELLDENPNHFSDQPDTASKLRKLQTRVEFRLAERVGFRVTDAGRARKVIPTGDTTSTDSQSANE